MRCLTYLAGICLILAAQAAAVIPPKCMAYRSLSTPTPMPNLINCPQYRDLACCDTTVDSMIIPNENGTQLYGFNWDRCGSLSPACQKFFQAESCYFECDPYQHPFGNPTAADPVGFVAIPVCGSYCNAWFEACKNDLTCGDEWMIDFVPIDDSQGNTVSYACAAGSQCKPFSEVFQNGKDLCDTLWGAAFQYTDETDNCVVWDWAQTTGNPNTQLERKPSKEAHCTADFVPPKPEPEVEPGCLAGREFTAPKEPEGDLGVCSRYKDLSCCGANVSNLITQDINDPSIHWYDWTQCQPLSAKCEAFFKAESCYYECDPYVHQWKNPILVAPDVAVGIPLCASTCDAWFEACQEDLTCGVEWLIDFTPITNPDGSVHGFKCADGSQCKTFAQVFQNSREMCDMLWGSHYYYSENADNCVKWDFDNKNPNKDVYKTYYAGEACPVVVDPALKEANTAAIVLGVFFAVTFVLFGTLIVIMIIRERKQAPLFGVPMARMN